MSLSESEYLTYLDQFNSFPMEPTKLRDLCFNSAIDASTTTLVLQLAERVLEAQHFLLKISTHLKDPKSR